MIVDFKFNPLQLVTVTAYGLRCQGRIMRCCYTSTQIHQYIVEFCVNGEINIRDFYEDELEPASGQ